MINVRKNKKGKLSIDLNRYACSELRIALLTHVERVSTSMSFNRLNTSMAVHVHLYETVLCELFQRNYEKLNSFNGEAKLTLTRSEAISLMMFLVDFEHTNTLFELKCALHKTLLP